jgi:zinc protease
MDTQLAIGLAPQKTVLENGLALLTKRTRTTPAVSINVAVRAGSACDPADAVGATWLLSRTIDRGTATRSASAIAEELDSRGITLSVGVSRHLFSLACTCLAEDFEPVFALVADVLTSPTLPERELETRKSEVVTSIRQDEDNPAVRATEALMALLYPDGHPYGRPTKGTATVVETLTRARLLRLHDERFAPSQVTAVIVGDVDPAQAQETAARILGGWRKPSPPPLVLPAVQPPSSRRTLVIPMMNKAQADIAYGFTTIRRLDPEYYAFWLMNNILGQYALGGRLGDSIRERQGMAYYVSSSLDANIAEGPLVIRAGVSPANVERAIRSIDDELRRLIADGITPQELDESRQYLIGSIPRALETNAGIAGFLQTAELFGLGLDYDVRLPDLLRAVTLDQANAAARRAVDPARATVVVAGPYEGRADS